MNIEKIGLDIKELNKPKSIQIFLDEFYRTYDEIEYKKMKGWWNGADKQKQDGLYVDYLSGIWSTPLFKKSDVEITEKYVYEIFQAILAYRLGHEAENILKKEKPEEYEKLIKLLNDQNQQ